MSLADDGSYYVVTAHGSVTFDEVVQAGGVATSLPGYQLGMSALWDFRDGDLTRLDREAFERLAEVVGAAPGRLGAKIAIVVVKDVDYGIARMWQVYGEDAPQQREIFRDMEKAQAWLRKG